MIKILCTLLSLFSEERSDDTFRGELNKSTKKAIERIETKYHATPCGSGGGTMYGVQSTMIAFNIEGPVSLEQARAIIVDSTEMYREELNSNKALRPYLAEYPFPVSKTEVEFYPINPKDAKNIISSFGISERRDGEVYITYHLRDENSKSKKVIEETYQQAVERLYGNNR